MEICTSTGTYMNSPFHRHPDKYKIESIRIENTIGKGTVIDVSDKGSKGRIFATDMESKIPEGADVVLFHTGWSKYVGTPEYFNSPALDYDAVEYLVKRRPKIVGIDGINVDISANKDFPAHTRLLANDILIVENLTNLAPLISKQFTFYATPLKVKDMASMPVRAFAVMDE